MSGSTQLPLGHRSLATTARYLRIAIICAKVCSTSSPPDLSLPHPIFIEPEAHRAPLLEKYRADGSFLKLEVADTFRRYGKTYQEFSWRVDVHSTAARS